MSMLSLRKQVKMVDNLNEGAVVKIKPKDVLARLEG